MIKNTENWNFFKIKDLFKIIKGNNVKILDIEEDPNGDIKLLSSTSINNGVVCMTKLNDVPEKLVHIYDEYILSITTNGECGVCFLQKGKIIKTSDVSLLIPKNKKINKKSLIFIKTIIEMEKYRYSWGKKNKGDKVANTLIKLPFKKIIYKNKINLTPDWDFMNDYIEGLLNRKLTLFEISKRKENKKPTPLEDKVWKKFKMNDIVEFIKVFQINKNQLEDIEDYQYKKIPYFTRTSNNNGIENFYNVIPKQPRNSISIGSVANKMFYQNEDFILGAYTVNIKLKTIMNQYVSMFFITIFNFESKVRYSFSNSIGQEKLANHWIKLPSKLNDNKKWVPDWKYMEEYIKSMPYSKYL